MNQKVLAIDVGTTAIKFDLYDKSKQDRIYHVEEPIQTIVGLNGEAYQQVNSILGKITDRISHLYDDYSFQQIVFSTAMHTLIPIEGDSFDRMYIWSDNQAHEVAKRIKDKSLGKKVYRRTGTPIHPMNPFCKLLYFKEKDPDAYRQVTRWADLKSILLAHICDEWVTDYSNASASGLFNSKYMCWDNELLEILDIKKEQLPEVVAPKTEFPCSTHMGNQFNGTDFTVVIGASDGCLASYASSQCTSTNTTLTIGTSGALRVISADRKVDSQGRYFCYYLNEESWVIGGPTNNGGKVLAWLSELIYQTEGEIFDQIEGILSRTTIGAKDLLFYPYVFGERAPLWDGTVTAKFDGLKNHHNKEDMVRAVIEGILFNLVYIARSMSIEEGPLAVSGGFFSIPGVLQLAADIFQQPLLVEDTNEPSYGAFLLTTDYYKGTNCRELKIIHPNTDLKGLYDNVYQKFSEGVGKMYL